MLITFNELAEQYQQIKADALRAGGGCTILLLVAPECDAICAARIIWVSIVDDLHLLN